MKIIFTQNDPRLSFWVKIVVILWIYSALQAVTPTPWLAQIHFTQISLSWLFKRVPFLTLHILWNRNSFTNTDFAWFCITWFLLTCLTQNLVNTRFPRTKSSINQGQLEINHKIQQTKARRHIDHPDHQNLPPFIFKGKIIQGSIRKDVDILLVKGPIVCSSSFLLSVREDYLDHNRCPFNTKFVSKEMKKG